MNRHWFGSLRARLLLLLLTASTLPLAVTTSVGYERARTLAERNTEELLSARAAQLADSLDHFHAQFMMTAERVALLPQTRAIFNGTPDQQKAAIAELNATFAVYEQSDARMRGVVITDLTQTIIAAGKPATAIGKKLFPRQFQADVLAGKSGISSVFISPYDAKAAPILSYGAPVRVDGKIVGMALVAVNASAFWEIVSALDGKAGAGSFSVVFDELGVRIAHSFSSSEIFRPAGRLSPLAIEQAVTEKRYGEHTREILEKPSEMPPEHAQVMGLQPVGLLKGVSNANGKENWGYGHKLKTAPWTVFFLVPTETVEEPMRRQLRQTALVSALIIALALLGGLWLASGISEPLNKLTDATEALKKGDLSARVHIENNGELGALAGAFNGMASELQSARTELELQVARRTQALSEAKADLERQNRELDLRGAELRSQKVRDQAQTQMLSSLMAPGELAKVLSDGLSIVSEPAGAPLIVCYRLEGHELVPAGAAGVPVERAHRVMRADLPPDLWTSGVRVLTSLPRGLELRIDLGLLTARPESIVLIPLVDGGRALGLVAAVSYSPEPPSVEFLGDLALPLALALARHELHQKTLDVAAELERRNEVLRRQAEELREQGNQLLLQSKDLEQKNREVARADQMKSEFLANMSHELRTPLNAVIGFSELLLSDRQHRLEGDQRRFVQDIHTSGRHLLELITDLLDLAKIESGGTTLHQSSISALDAIDAAVELLTPAAEQKHLEITNHATPDLFTNADPAKLRQVLLNLGSNAVKFSAEGGPIDFGAERQDGTVRFFVRDAGPGIDDSLMPRLFTPFVQGESAFVKRHQGTGLGLAISRRIVEAHGGTIGVETKPGQGSTFWFTLPIGVAPLDVVRAKPEAITPPHAPSSMPLIVVIEDDPATQRLIEAYLTRGGYRISMCERADGAAALVDELQPAAVLLDLNLHGQDGLLVLAELKKNPSTRTIPVVIESVFADKQHGLVLGAEAHLTKPFDRNALLDRLAQLVRVRTGEPTRVLLIDDDPAVGEILRPMLKTAGYELLVAVEGTEGIAVAAAEKPALAIVDLMLPDMSGLDVIDALAADPRSSQLPVLVLTGADLTEEERSRLLKRVNALAQKSDFSADTLLDAIGRAVGKKAEPAPQVKGPRILVVDDHDLNRELVRAILEQANYEVLEAEDGEDGGRVARRERPELILLDLAMPKKSGYEMLLELRADPSLKHTPVVALTAMAMRSDEERALSSGFDGYVSKPIDARTLLDLVERFLARARRHLA